VFALQEDPAGEALLNEALHRFENGGLLHSARDRSGRRYELTAAGRARLRAERRFRASLVGLLARSHFTRI
jgi:DNA-binding PadR family transcriptional regulator